jgi:hypothetical protein
MWHGDVAGRLAALARLSTTLGRGPSAVERGAAASRARGSHAFALAVLALLVGTLLAAGITHGDASHAFANAGVPDPRPRVAPAVFDGGVSADADVGPRPTTLETRFQELR